MYFTFGELWINELFNKWAFDPNTLSTAKIKLCVSIWAGAKFQKFIGLFATPNMAWELKSFFV